MDQQQIENIRELAAAMFRANAIQLRGRLTVIGAPQSAIDALGMSFKSVSEHLADEVLMHCGLGKKTQTISLKKSA